MSIDKYYVTKHREIGFVRRVYGTDFTSKHIFWRLNQVTKMIKIYNAKDAIEAEEIVVLLKENGIPSYSQNASGGVAAHSMSGFSLYGVDVFVDEADAEKAKGFISDR